MTEYEVSLRVRLPGRFDPATVLNEIVRGDTGTTAELLSVEVTCADGMPLDPEEFV